MEKHPLHRQLKESEEEKRALRKEKERNRTTEPTRTSGSDSLQCGYCKRICGSRIGLYSHTRRCSNRAINTPTFSGNLNFYLDDPHSSVGTLVLPYISWCIHQKCYIPIVSKPFLQANVYLEIHIYVTIIHVAIE